jgi:hypothetical protein
MSKIISLDFNICESNITSNEMRNKNSFLKNESVMKMMNKFSKLKNQKCSIILHLYKALEPSFKRDY